MRWDHKQSIKELLKHIAYRTRLQGLVAADRKRRGFQVAHLEGEEPSDRFRSIYESGAWVMSSSQHSSSGTGSEAASTASLVTELPEMLDTLGCQTMVDVGCGDWNWMREMRLPPHYVGVDIVEDVIDTNRKFEREGVRFHVANAIEDPLPDADVALCREMLFHLSFQDGLAVLANIRKSARWLIATTDPDIWFNSDIRTGDFRRLNLQRRPYYLPPPAFTIGDGAISSHRALGIWATEDLPV